MFLDINNFLRSRKDFIITRADKGGKTVNLDSFEYIIKKDELLQDATIYEKISINPLKKVTE